jgi:hypothetical protein
MTHNLTEVYLKSLVNHISLHQTITVYISYYHPSLHKFQHSAPVQTTPTPITMSSTNQYDAPSGDVVDDDYKSRTGQSAIPVQSDGAAVEATEYDNGGDSDKQLGNSRARSLFILSLIQHREG